MAQLPPSPVRDRADDSLFTLIGDVPELVRNLVIAEVDAAKKWAAKTAKDAGFGTGWMLVALFFLFWAIPAFLCFVIALLSLWLPVWASALIVFGVGVILAAVFALLGLLRFKRLAKSENPASAARTDVAIVKEVANEF
ncbi:phage holin family protein [Microbacterium oryzae]|uniref:Phage holin family protein n=1 Tax=Microbacterium oryzae TaxID=743009 RepID=A0A6I6EB72_9MICO|nr:phage holin family protein [Microbacterium oryzae]MDN3310884.1 phage holin family protein [Microbacterium oryzae]QGU28298.1 phage holin family protein [Microbacterium oryzae]